MKQYCVFRVDLLDFMVPITSFRKFLMKSSDLPELDVLLIFMFEIN